MSGERYLPRDAPRSPLTAYRSPLVRNVACVRFLAPQVRRVSAREPRQDLAGSSAKRCPVQLRGAWGTPLAVGRTGGQTDGSVPIQTRVSRDSFPSFTDRLTVRPTVRP